MYIYVFYGGVSMIQLNNTVLDIEKYEEEQIENIRNKAKDNSLVTIGKLANFNNKVREVSYLGIKRVFDFSVAFLSLIVLSPIFLIVSIAIKNESKGNAIYSQMRIGKNGKLFKLYKFRTMVKDADDELNIILNNDESARLEYSKNKKLKNDPRVTKIGRFLRKTSIDELPQLLNVLKGEMSLVGPRPYLKREKEDMIECYDSIIQCKPGITGLWQVSGRSNTTFEERLKYDVDYNQKKNLIEDGKILLKTFKVILKKEGAM